MSSSEEDDKVKEPKSKKVKTENDDDDGEDDGAPKKKEVERNEDGEPLFMLSGKRRCTVRKWKDNVLIDIREVYEKNGKMLPGKKGISLSLDQYKELKKIVVEGDIDDEIKRAGGDV